MRVCSLLPLLALATPALAQNYYVPDNDPTTGICNVIPFGQPSPGTFYNARVHMRATAADLGNTANLITGLAFSCCNTGRADYGSLEIVLDHIPATQSLSTTFANNLTPNAITVLFAPDYIWNLQADVWSEVGLQEVFPYNGVDDLLIQITTSSGITPGGMHRGTRQRVYALSAAGTPAATGTSSMSATKFEVSMLTGHTSSHGDGCAGSNGTPLLGFTGTATVGNVLSFDLSNGVPSGVAVILASITNAAPFPIDLTSLNMPGCFLYTDLVFTDLLVLDANGAGSYPYGVTSAAVGFRFYTQFACLDPLANVFGLTTSNYGRVLAGN